MNKKNNKKATTIEKEVMAKIQTGKVHMRPRSYFILLGSLIAIAISLLSFVSVYLMSVWTFWQRIIINDRPAFGAKRNLANLLETFPWWALILGIVLLICIIYLVKKTGHMYKIRLVYLIPIIIVGFIIVGFVLSYSDLPVFFNGHGSNMMDGSYNRGRLMK